MTLSPRLLVAASILVVPSLAVAGRDTVDRTSTFRETHACGTRQVPNLLASPPPVWHADAPRTVFLNRGGGTYHIIGGRTNSATQSANASVSNRGTGDITIAPLAAGFDWAAISQCVQDHYAAYDLVFTETRPPGGLYLEAVVGGSGTELGFPRDSLFGIAAADNFCGVTEAGIAFSFSETHRGVPDQDGELCATIAHEVGHLLALEHETLAADLMSYVLVSESPSKAFVDQVATCGVEPGGDQPCACGTMGLNNRTNSALRLNMWVGPRRPRLGQGEACTSGGECAGGQCVTQDGFQFCTQVCDTANDTCPEGYECQSAGSFAVCGLPSEGGCCSTGQRPGAGTLLAGLGVGLLLVRRRRKA